MAYEIIHFDGETSPLKIKHFYVWPDEASNKNEIEIFELVNIIKPEREFLATIYKRINPVSKYWTEGSKTNSSVKWYLAFYKDRQIDEQTGATSYPPFKENGELKIFNSPEDGLRFALDYLFIENL